jgi:hypothetical protein
MTFEIALVNISDGTVQGHKAGCADLTRGNLRKHNNDAWTFEVQDKAEAWFDYNSDFLAEGGPENAYDIDWKPCANHVPDGDKMAAYNAAFGEDHTPVAYQAPVVETTEVSAAGVTIKVGRKWTTMHAADGTLIAEVRNDAYDAVSRLIGFTS